MEKKFSVSLWGSHPEAGNDDCWTGDDFATLDEAKHAAANLADHFRPGDIADAAYITIEESRVVNGERGVWFLETIANPLHKPRKRRDDDADWRREQAMQAGMAFGVDGYNDAMGWGSEPYDD